MPRRSKSQQRRLETSVCRSEGLSESQIWAISSKYFDPYSLHPAIGRGDGRASVVFDANLEIDPDGTPYLEHANIVGWYDSADKPDNEMKHFWMEKAQTMAPNFRFVARSH